MLNFLYNIYLYFEYLNLKGLKSTFHLRSIKSRDSPDKYENKPTKFYKN